MNYDDEDDYKKENDVHDIQVTYCTYTTNIKYECIDQRLNAIISKLFHSISDKWQ